jgi:YebC/PmpR family DNA-binding regulatory protein
VRALLVASYIRKTKLQARKQEQTSLKCASVMHIRPQVEPTIRHCNANQHRDPTECNQEPLKISAIVVSTGIGMVEKPTQLAHKVGAGAYMSGHNKWSTIKHKKAATDAKRGAAWTKVIKEITVASRMGGGDIGGNPRLRKAVDDAKIANMPKDNIERAIKKGTGELEGVNYEEGTLEGYGPGGAAVYVEFVTDVRNRATTSIRSTFSKCNGSLGKDGCVAYLFSKKALFVFDKSKVDENRLMEVALEAGAQDVRDEGETFEVFADQSAYEELRQAFESNTLTYESGDITMIPSTTVKLVGKEAEQMIRLIEKLEDNEDVQNVYSNFDIDAELLEQLTNG